MGPTNPIGNPTFNWAGHAGHAGHHQHDGEVSVPQFDRNLLIPVY